MQLEDIVRCEWFPSREAPWSAQCNNYASNIVEQNVFLCTKHYKEEEQA